MLGRGAAARTGIDHVEHDARIKPGFHPHDHRFRCRRHGSGGQHVIAKLHGLAGAGLLADIEKFPDRFERRLDRFDISARTRCHHCDRAFLGAAHAAGNRRIDLHDAAGGQRLEDALRHDCAGGGKVDEALNALAFDHAIGSGRGIRRDNYEATAHHHALQLCQLLDREQRAGKRWEELMKARDEKIKARDGGKR